MTEILIAVALTALVTAGSLSTFVLCQNIWARTTLDMEVCRRADLAILKMMYGGGTNGGLRSATSVRIGSDRIDYVGTAGIPGCFVLTDDCVVNEYGQVLCRSVDALTFEKDGRLLTITVRVAKEEGRFDAAQEVTKVVNLRNE
ncbi:MAG: hypothetical protein JXR37_34205 [Kiritimatiellae bacterium]|nr:hypothetical protein [Kiritimatiellia bacterium]